MHDASLSLGYIHQNIVPECIGGINSRNQAMRGHAPLTHNLCVKVPTDFQMASVENYHERQSCLGKSSRYRVSTIMD